MKGAKRGSLFLVRKFCTKQLYNEKYETLLRVVPTEHNLRFDKWVAKRFPGVTNAHLQKLLRKKRISAVRYDEQGNSFLQKIKASERVISEQEYIISNEITNPVEKPEEEREEKETVSIKINREFLLENLTVENASKRLI